MEIIFSKLSGFITLLSHCDKQNDGNRHGLEDYGVQKRIYSSRKNSAFQSPTEPKHTSDVYLINSSSVWISNSLLLTLVTTISPTHY